MQENRAPVRTLVRYTRLASADQGLQGGLAPPRNECTGRGFLLRRDPMGMWGGPKDQAYEPRAKLAWITPSAEASSTDAGYFLDCIEAGRESDVSVSLAAAATEVLLAAYTSAQSGQTVDLPLPRKAT